jgi:hypothetical protein
MPFVSYEGFMGPVSNDILLNDIFLKIYNYIYYLFR